MGVRAREQQLSLLPARSPRVVIIESCTNAAKKKRKETACITRHPSNYTDASHIDASVAVYAVPFVSAPRDARKYRAYIYIRLVVSIIKKKRCKDR